MTEQPAVPMRATAGRAPRVRRPAPSAVNACRLALRGVDARCHGTGHGEGWIQICGTWTGDFSAVGLSKGPTRAARSTDQRLVPRWKHWWRFITALVPELGSRGDHAWAEGVEVHLAVVLGRG